MLYVTDLVRRRAVPYNQTHDKEMEIHQPTVALRPSANENR
jgi:hypothetical protein